MKAVLLAFVLASASAYGQFDLGTTAVEQATTQLNMQAGYLAGQQAQQDMLLATQNAQQVAQANLQASQQQFRSVSSASKNPFQTIGTEQPNFSIKSGKVKPGTEVRIKWRCCDYSKVYYSLDGWAPTTASSRYKGPITITCTTHIQAIAVGASMRSRVIEADYLVDTPTTAPIEPLATDGLLHSGTTLRLVTNSLIDSKYARVGDRIPLLLDQDVKMGDSVVIPKGTAVDASLTSVVPSAGDNMPGKLVFVVHSFNIQGKPVLLRGGETLEAVAGRDKKEAVIEPGMIVYAAVTADTTLKP